jgi:hypothetical protein
VRPLLVIAVVVAGGLLLGLDPPYARTYRAELPADPGADEGTIDLPALPIRLHDFSGVVEGIEVAEGDGPGEGAPWIEAEPVAGGPTSLRIDWMGGACTPGVRIVLTGAAGALRLELEEQQSWAIWAGCPAVGVFRSVLVRFLEPVAPADVSFAYELG